MVTAAENKARPARMAMSRKKAKVDESESQSPEVEKKSKATRGKRGMLASLPDLPLDVLFEILAHLGPYDLLKLARTSKEYRLLLLNRSCISVWKTVLSNVPGLPPCPDDMSEPAYANLAFSPHCAACLAHAKNVTWNLRARYCNKCAREGLQTLKYQRPNSYHRLMFDGTLTFNRLAFPSLIPCYFKKRDEYFFLSDLDDFANEYFATPEERRGLFIEERKKYITERYKHAALCNTWSKAQVVDRSAELQQMRDERKAAIIEKLEELDLGDEIRSIKLPDSLNTHKLVDKPQRLTPRIWANIKPEIIAFMDMMRENRLKREFNTVLFKRKLVVLDILADFKRTTHIDNDAIMPSPADICEIPVIREILHRPIDVPVDRPSFDDVVFQLPPLVNVWRESLRSSLHDVVKKALPNANIAVVELAATVFICSTCSKVDNYVLSEVNPLFYPQVQGHRCLSRCTLSWLNDPARSDDPSLQFAYPFSKRIPWNGAPLAISTRASAIARGLVGSVGLDAETATGRDMDALHLRFYCQLCTQGLGISTGCLMTWRAAIKHFCNMHSNSRHAIDKAFKKFRQEDIPESIVSAEQKELNRSKIWQCLICHDTPAEIRPMSKAGIKRHVGLRHSKEAPVEHEDYSEHLAAVEHLTSSMQLYVRYKDGNFELPSLMTGLCFGDSETDIDSDGLDDLY